jgi:hypothetical protein
MPKRLILFNGPPRSGKDTAASHIYKSTHGAIMFKMSAPLKQGVRAFFDLTDAEVRELEATKDTPSPLLFNYSYRDVQISLSEHWAKEFFGFHVFGKLAARKLRRAVSNVFICSDSGFDYEAKPLIDYIGPANTLLVRLHRAGKTFDKDSRGHITFGPDAGVTEVDMFNNGSVRDFERGLDAVVGSWLQQSDN